MADDVVIDQNLSGGCNLGIPDKIEYRCKDFVCLKHGPVDAGAVLKAKCNFTLGTEIEMKGRFGIGWFDIKFLDADERNAPLIIRLHNKRFVLTMMSNNWRGTYKDGHCHREGYCYETTISGHADLPPWPFKSTSSTLNVKVLLSFI